MVKFTEKTFKIPLLKGISSKNIEEHIKLYGGYVKNANLVLERINEYMKEPEKRSYELGELHRRFSFEFNGIKNHESYFAAFEDGPKPIDNNANLKKMLIETWGSFDAWLNEFKLMGLTRGIGWAMLYYDKKEKNLLNAWVDEQHFGQLQDCALILGMDMWEHSYIYDYQPSGKKNYIEDFFANINWKIIENNLKSATSE